MATFQDLWPRQSSLGVAAGEDRLQVHLQQEVYGGGLSDVAPTQPGTLHVSSQISTKRGLSRNLQDFWTFGRENIHTAYMAYMAEHLNLDSPDYFITIEMFCR